jgi:predicted CoA-binding protein
MDPAISEFLESRSIAVVGFSRNARKFGSMAYEELRRRGFDVLAVHPTEREIRDVRCAPSLRMLQNRVDAVLVCVPPSGAVAVLEDAAAAGIRKVWLQQGSESPDVLAAASRLGLRTVAKKCILLYAPPVRSYHGWHRAVARVFGRL